MNFYAANHIYRERERERERSKTSIGFGFWISNGFVGRFSQLAAEVSLIFMAMNTFDSAFIHSRLNHMILDLSHEEFLGIFLLRPLGIMGFLIPFGYRENVARKS